MFKKISLIGLTISFMVILFSGCAKYTPPYHSYKYYSKHEKQALKVYSFCNKNYPGWQGQEAENRAAATRIANCANARSGYMIHNIFTVPKPPKLN
jgi:hypothetical protein